jgi:hypothetical protein
MKRFDALFFLIVALLLGGCLPNDNTLGSTPPPSEPEPVLRLFWNFNPVTGENLAQSDITAGSASYPLVYLAKGNPATNQWAEVTEVFELRAESECAEQGTAEISPNRMTHASRAEFYYLPKLSCWRDQLSIYVADHPDIPPIQESLVVNPPKPVSLVLQGLQNLNGEAYEYKAGDPVLMGVRNATNNLALPESLQLRFKVLDNTGQIAGAGHQLRFSILPVAESNTNSAGSALLLTEEGISNTDGEVAVVVQSGSRSFSFRVRAQLVQKPEVFVFSPLIEVNSGLIDVEYMDPIKQEKTDVGFKLTFLTPDYSGRAALVGAAVDFSVNKGVVDPECRSGEPGIGLCEVEWRGSYNIAEPAVLFTLTASGLNEQGQLVTMRHFAVYDPNDPINPLMLTQ